MRRPNRWILATGAMLALVAAGAALPPPASATELTGLRVAAVPALPVANHPWRISVDFSGTGDPGWCRWQRDELLRQPPTCSTSRGRPLDIWVYRAEPAAPCLEQIPPHRSTSDVPAITHRVRLSADPGYAATSASCKQETLPRRRRRHAAGGRRSSRSRPIASGLSVTYRDPRDGLWRRARGCSAPPRRAGNSGSSTPAIRRSWGEAARRRRGSTGHFWLFASSLTTLEFELRDRRQRRRLPRPPGRSLGVPGANLSPGLGPEPQHRGHRSDACRHPSGPKPPLPRIGAVGAPGSSPLCRIGATASASSRTSGSTRTGAISARPAWP